MRKIIIPFLVLPFVMSSCGDRSPRYWPGNSPALVCYDVSRVDSAGTYFLQCFTAKSDTTLIKLDLGCSHHSGVHFLGTPKPAYDERVMGKMLDLFIYLSNSEGMYASLSNCLVSGKGKYIRCHDGACTGSPRFDPRPYKTFAVSNLAEILNKTNYNDLEQLDSSYTFNYFDFIAGYSILVPSSCLEGYDKLTCIVEWERKRHHIEYSLRR